MVLVRFDNLIVTITLTEGLAGAVLGLRETLTRL